MIKCIAADMDGTLLNSTAKKITNENRLAILEAQAKGIEFVIATGRVYDEVIYLLEESGLDCPVIAMNGAEIRTKDGEITSINPLDMQEAKAAALKLQKHDVYFEVYTDKGKFTNNREKAISVILDIIMSTNPDANREVTMEYARKRVKKMRLTHDYNGLFCENKYVIYKFLAFSLDEEKLIKVHEELAGMKGIAVSSSGHKNLEITDYRAQKGIALEQFVKEKNIALEETMAIGDNFNDVSMFKRAGRSVAMGNAAEAIKAQCDFVTATNDENGVAEAIREAIRERVYEAVKSPLIEKSV